MPRIEWTLALTMCAQVCSAIGQRVHAVAQNQLVWALSSLLQFSQLLALLYSVFIARHPSANMIYAHVQMARMRWMSMTTHLFQLFQPRDDVFICRQMA